MLIDISDPLGQAFAPPDNIELDAWARRHIKVTQTTGGKAESIGSAVQRMMAALTLITWIGGKPVDAGYREYIMGEVDAARDGLKRLL